MRRSQEDSIKSLSGQGKNLKTEIGSATNAVNVEKSR